MNQLPKVDKGGRIAANEMLVSDKIIGFIQSMDLNTSLGTDKDPYEKEYLEFIEELENTGILSFDSSQISTGKYDNIDLTEPDVEGDGILILEDDDFFEPAIHIATGRDSNTKDLINLVAFVSSDWGSDGYLKHTVKNPKMISFAELI